VCLFRQCSFSHIHREWYRHTEPSVAPSSLVFISEIQRMCLVMKIVPMLYQFPKCSNFSETPFTYGIYTVARGLTSLLGRLLPFMLITESVKSQGYPLSWRSRLRLLISLHRSWHSWHMVEALWILFLLK
jgi:hypothetical protein